LKGADALIALTPVEIRLIQKLREVKYGSVTAHIQDGKIVQMDKEEKERFR
jgi:hypothetical protein